MSSRARSVLFTVCSIAAGSSYARRATAADDLTILDVLADRPTLHMAGVQLLISDDDNRNATVATRYREADGSDWRDGPPLMRVRPETVSLPIAAQFAGSVFDLSPATAYEIELHAQDPDGLDEIVMVAVNTRAVPVDPATPNVVMVGDAGSLAAALAAAAPGDVITLADGVYAGSSFSLNASGTANEPIVLRGASQGGAVLDGEGCTGCNILEVYGSYVHIESMTFRNAERALRFQGDGATGNVARRLIVRDVVHGIASRPNQTEFVLCDNDIEGRLVWPWTFDSDATSHWDDRGIEVTGDGHVVCHNRLVGFGDPVVNKKNMSRSWDVYGNDIRDSYDGTELDESEGNARLVWNRFVNVMDPVSIQPVRGGPAYVLRNVILNAPEEQVKLKSLGGTDEPSGALIHHNTFVSPNLSLNLQTPITQHNFIFSNNLCVGPEVLAGARTVEWTAALDDGRFDANGYYPDGGFWFGVVGGVNQTFASFAEATASGSVEQNGVLLVRPIFERDIVGPADPMDHLDALDVTPSEAGGALDAAMPLSGLNSKHIGAAADLGAIERGCPAPVFGPRPQGMDAETNLVDCGAAGEGGGGQGGAGQGGNGSGANGNAGGSAASGGGSPEPDGPGSGGCGCDVPRSTTWAPGSLALALVFVAGVCRRRRRHESRRHLHARLCAGFSAGRLRCLERAAVEPDVELPTQEPATKPTAPARMVENVTPIETPLASGDGWACEDKAYTEPVVAFTSKCIRSDADLFLLAKVYEVPPEQVATVKVLVEEIYPRNYAKMFDSFKVKSTQPARIGSHDGLDIHIDAVNAKGPLRMHERVVVQGAQVFIITEMGSPPAFDAFQAIRSKWFSETKFRDLR